MTGPAPLAELARGCDVLLLAADEPHEIQRWANRACLATGTPWVEAGYNGPLVGVGSFVPGEGACFECLLAADDERRRAQGLRREDAPDWSAAVAGAVAAPSAAAVGRSGRPRGAGPAHRGARAGARPALRGEPGGAGPSRRHRRPPPAGLPRLWPEPRGAARA